MWAGNIGFDIRLQYYQVHYVFLCYVACLRYIIHPNVNFNITKNGYTETFFWGDYKNSIKYLHLLHYFVSTAGHRRKAAHRYTYSTNLTKTPWKKNIKSIQKHHYLCLLVSQTARDTKTFISQW